MKLKWPFLKLKTKVKTEVKTEEKVVIKKPSKTACYFCSRKAPDMRKYKNDANQKIVVCSLCVEYAERRAYRKL